MFGKWNWEFLFKAFKMTLQVWLNGKRWHKKYAYMHKVKLILKNKEP